MTPRLRDPDEADQPDGWLLILMPLGALLCAALIGFILGFVSRGAFL